MFSRRYPVVLLLMVTALAMAVFGCGKSSKKSTNPVAPLEMDHTLAPGAVFQHTFATAGAYPYHCTFHASMGMTGIVIVAPNATPGDSTVTIVNFTFNPNSVTIPVGGTVTWTNTTGSTTHTVTSD